MIILDDLDDLVRLIGTFWSLMSLTSHYIYYRIMVIGDVEGRWKCESDI